MVKFAHSRMLAAILLGIAVTPLTLAEATEKVVEVQEESHHRVVFENSLVRILEANIPAGSLTLFHRHRRDNIAVGLTDAKVANQHQGESLPSAVPRTAGAVYFSTGDKSAYVHRIVNTGATAYRVVDVELIAPPDARAAPLALSTPVAIDNDRVRAYSVTVAPGQSSAPLSLGHGVLVVLERAAQWTVSFASKCAVEITASIKIPLGGARSARISITMIGRLSVTPVVDENFCQLPDEWGTVLEDT